MITRIGPVRVLLASCCVLLPWGAGAEAADSAELRKLRATVNEMSKTIDELKTKIDRLEREAAPAPATAAAPAQPAPDEPLSEDLLAPQGQAPQLGVVRDRDAFRNEQEAAARVDNVPLDPAYRGFIAVPNTRALIRFNAKPRVDFTFDNRNAGDDNRFVTAKIPVRGQAFTSANYGGGNVTNVNAKGSQLSIDVRAPSLPGSPRFYYQNDFFGSGGGEFPYRLRFLYGSWYNLTLGQAFSVFEDPDVWPDTVDYEGPNAMIFARRALARYAVTVADEWTLNFGIEQPDTLAAPYFGQSVTGVNRAPDGTMNVRWESPLYGHAQLSSVLRALGTRGGTFGSGANARTFRDRDVLGWGVSGTGAFHVWEEDWLQLLATYGEGIGAYGNDTGFFNNDVAYDTNGDLQAIPYLGLFAGYTHYWNEDWRSTATYGFVRQEPEFSQGPFAYQKTQYASLNVIYQIRERFSVGLEGLYGRNQKASGDDGDVVRVQVGFLYSIF
jgi:outer membrane murein-binding lipoprotein Lpp